MGANSASHLTILPLGTGSVLLDDSDGMPRSFVHPTAPARRYILDEETESWHTAEHRWGSGFAITDRGTMRWNSPDSVRFDAGGVVAEYDLGERLRLVVDRRGGDRLEERYRFINASAEAVVLLSIAISVPVRDIYPSASESLRTAVHAHVFTGGEWAWVIAQPMDGSAPVLTLRVIEGRLDAYSIESRNAYSFSNVRGHLLLQPTDFARNPRAFGGQHPITVAAFSEYTTAWELCWHDSVESFIREGTSSAGFTAFAASTHESIEVRVPRDVSVSVSAVASLEREGEIVRVRSSTAGAIDFYIGGSQTALLFHDPLEELVARRVGYILRYQRARGRAGVDRFAFVPVDTRTRLTTLTSGWPDWSDGAERVAMPVLLQQALMRGWVESPAEVNAALRDWAQFARQRLLDRTGAPRWGSDTIISRPRLYNSPWLAHFFADQFRLGGDRAELDLAAGILERSFELSAERHLSIGQPEALLAVATLLDEVGDSERAANLRAGLVANASYFAELGEELPSHEVNYEQSMVAPLVSLYSLASRVVGDDRFMLPLVEALRWLQAFGGPQPHFRLHHIGIRHWDGYFFGLDRLWGDVFPHYWSVLSAIAFSQLPDRLLTPHIDRAASHIFRSNLGNYSSDGAATAAFVFPSTVDGRTAHHADPLANDQDWSLALWLRSGWALDADGTPPDGTRPRGQKGDTHEPGTRT